jgi:hypothetical protein
MKMYSKPTLEKPILDRVFTYFFSRDSLLVLLIIMLFTAFAHSSQPESIAQTPQEKNDDCKSIDADRAAVSISFVKFIQGHDSIQPKTKPKVLLRLENNLTCPIFVSVMSPDDIEFVKKPDGGIVRQRTTILKAGSDVSLVYLLLDPSNAKAPILVSGDVLFGRELRAGDNINFKVDLHDLKNGFDVGVQFNCECENHPFGRVDGKRTVYFRANQLPK